MRIHGTVLASALIPLAIVGCGAAERGDSGEIERAGGVDAFTLRVGDCYNDRVFGGDQVSDVPGIPCGEAHDNEVYATFDLPGGAWPGSEFVDEAADLGCLERFQGAIGATYEESVLMYTTLYPTEGSWEERSDREVICAAYHMELEKLTGSVLGSRR